MSSYGRQTANGVCGSIREAFILDESCKKVAAFSPLVLKSNIF